MLGQVARQLVGRAVGAGDRDGRHTPGQAVALGDAPHLETRPGRQPFEQTLRQPGLVTPDGGQGRLQPLAPSCPGAETGQVLDGGQDARQTLVILGAGHPAIGQRFRRGLDLVGRQRFQQCTAAPKDADVGAEELVRRAGQEIAVPILHIDRPMRRIVDGIEKDLGSRAVSQPTERFHVVDRADHVGGTRHRQPADPLVQVAAQVIEVQRAILGPNVDEACLGPGITRGQHPGPNVGIMIQPRNQHDVTGSQRAANGAAQVKGERRHVLAENDLVR